MALIDRQDAHSHSPGTSAYATTESLPFRALLVDDHPLYVEGLSLSLSRFRPNSHIHACQSVPQAQQLLQNRFDIDLVLIDLHLRDSDGLALLHFMAQHGLLIPAAILSASEKISDVNAALQSGARGFISKSGNSAEILFAIDRILEGEIWLPHFYTPSTPKDEDLRITPRQQEVLKLLAAGLPNKKICTTLGLTEHTVKTHLKALFNLLNVHNRTECVNVATRMGLLA